MKEIENFISNEESDYLMQYHKENFNLNKKSNFMWRGTEVIDIGESSKFKELRNKFNNLVKSEDKDHVVSYFQIVRWPTGEWQPPHLDLYGHTYSSILYLNDDYEGGETVVLNETATPKKNKIIFFRGNRLIHKVNEITKGVRYTVPCWYKYESKS